MACEIPPEHREFNGYIFVDKRVEVGRRAVMDGHGTVHVHSLNTIFATVSSHEDTSKWAVTRGRLTGLSTNAETMTDSTQDTHGPK